MGRVRTVLGDIDPAELGPTYCHEHLVTAPGERFLSDGSDMVLDDEQRSARELVIFEQLGGGGLVEVSTPEFGRDVAALRRLSSTTGVQIVCCTGHVSEEYWRGMVALDERSDEELYEELVHEITVGINGTDVRAGVIKVGTSRDRATDVEARVLRAAGRTQVATGVSVTTHTTDGTAALEQLAVLVGAGADPEKVCIGHLDRRLDEETNLQVAKMGAYVGHDSISKEKYEPEQRRVESILRLVEAGYGDRILLSGDMARRSYLESWGGGPGYRYILERFVPLLLDAGLDRDAADRLLVDNPARFLSLS
jgi:phosphotriesterase-related protein